ncbi:MAG TPA: hypothetical protein VGN42_02810 [Pirellulales bacterium]|nr:hypothetical protein [Pirellulales bacterium]
MLIPQFSLRSVLYVTAICAVLSLVAAMAMRGTAWAMALTVAVASLSITFLAYGAMFFAVWVFSLVAPRRRAARETAYSSPFEAGR